MLNYYGRYLEELADIYHPEMKPYIKTIQGLALSIQCFGGEFPFFFLSGNYKNNCWRLRGILILYNYYDRVPRRLCHQAHWPHEFVLFDVCRVCRQISSIFDYNEPRLGFTGWNVQRRDLCTGLRYSHFIRCTISTSRSWGNASRARRDSFYGTWYIYLVLSHISSKRLSLFKNLSFEKKRFVV